MSIQYRYHTGNLIDINARVTLLDSKIIVDLELGTLGTYISTVYDNISGDVVVTFSSGLSKYNILILNSLTNIILYDQIVGTNVYVVDNNATLRNSYSTNSLPSIQNDINNGYSVGSLVTTSSGDIYMCTDDTSGAAIWKSIGVTGPTGASSTVTGPTGASSTVTGPTGASSTVTGPTGASSTVTGPTGASSIVTGPTGASSTITGPTGASSTVTGPTGGIGPTGPSAGGAGAPIYTTSFRSNNNSVGITNGTSASANAAYFTYPGNAVTATTAYYVLSSSLLTGTSFVKLTNINNTVDYGTFTGAVGPSLTTYSQALGTPNALPNSTSTLRIVYNNGGSGTLTLYSFALF